MVRRLFLVPRGFTTTDEDLAKEVEDVLQQLHQEYQALRDGQWYKVYPKDLSGFSTMEVARYIAKKHPDVEVWLGLSKVEFP